MPAKLSAMPALKRPRFWSFLLLGMLVFALAEVNEVQAAPAYRASGTFTAGVGTITPPYPASMAANDVCLLAVESENQAISLTTANGFAEVPTWSPQFAGTAATNPASRLALFWKRTVGGDTAPLVADSGDHTTGQIHCFLDVTTSGNPWDTGAGGNDGAANDTTGAIPGSTTTVAETLVALITSTSFNGTSTAQCSFGANADLTSLTERTDNTNTAGLGGGHCMATGVKASASAYANTTVTLANTSFKGAISLALKPFGTRLGNGADPAPPAAPLAPGGAATMADAFTFQTGTGTDVITAAVVGLSVGSSGGLSLVEITNDAGTTVYGSVANPASDTPTITLSTNTLTATTTLTQYKIRITPKSHAAMQVPPGSTYLVTAKINSWTGTNPNEGTDTAGTTVTIDNLSPGDVTAASGTAGNAQVVFTWANPVSPVETVAYSIVVLRSTAGPVADTPVEGTTYIVGNTVGTSEVRCVVTGLPPATTCTDTGLTNGTAYHYRIFTRDSNGNFSTPGVVPTGSPFTPAANCYAVNPLTADWNVATTWASTSGGVAGTCAGAGGIPDGGSAVFIGETATGRTVTIPASYAASAASVTIGNATPVTGPSSLTLTGTGASLTTSGSVTVNRPNAAATNVLAIGANTVTAGGNVTLGGTGTTATFIASITLSTGTLNIAGNLVFITGNVASNLLTITGAGTINLAGAFTATVGTLTPGTTSIFNYNGAVAQTIPIGVSSINYRNLHVNNTSASGATLSAAISAARVLGNLRVQSGILNNGGFVHVGPATTFEVANGARFNLTGTTNIPTGFTTRTFGATSTVNFQGGNQTIASGLTYGHLILDGGSTKTMAAGTTTIAGNFTLGTGTTRAATNNPTVNLAGNFSNSGTFNSGTGVFTFNGTAAGQTISGNATTFTSLTIANTHASGVTANTALTIGTFIINLSSTFNAGSASLIHNISGDFTKDGTFTAGDSTIVFNGTALQTFLPASSTSFYNLTINNTDATTPSGVSMFDFDVIVTKLLDLVSGILSMDPTATTPGVIISSTGNVTRASGHVGGGLTKFFPAGSDISRTFEVGDLGTTANPVYAPLVVTFDSISVAGSLRAYAIKFDHPQIGASTNLDATASANRYWGLQNPNLSIGLSPPTFTSYNASVTFANGISPNPDLDATVNAAIDIPQFILERYNVSETPKWSTLNVTSALDDSPLVGQGTVAGDGATGTGDFATSRNKNPEYVREVQFLYTSERP
ncbi:MAG: hypothetical protein Q7U07_06380 [Gammaproteobacteria bacterium]|nr:hypothetical protein [Gammaproteobacteria bacterium]